jgi:LmbE family N-acetylglucosaminyl deacetylase
MRTGTRDGQRFTVVSFHAHPDDEALLTAGTLARAVAEGHRVVIVVATDGDAGLAGGGLAGTRLADRRRAELVLSARAIGAARVCFLGFPDSGFRPDRGAATRRLHPESFAALPAEVPARALADLLTEERADVLTTYDARGGYGHPDHVQVHHVGRLAAQAAGTSVVLEATLDRDRLLSAVRALRRARRLLPLPAMPDLSEAYTPAGELTHRVDVRRHVGTKRACLAAHASQAGGGESIRTVSLLLRLPRPLRRHVLGTEWFREVGRAPGGALLDDVFASLRER